MATHSLTVGVGGAVRLSLLGGFELVHRGQPVSFAPAAQRLVAFLALRSKPQVRALIAETLWPVLTEKRALACLRSALWRLRRPQFAVVEAEGARLRLTPDVRVDVHDLASGLHALAVGDAGVDDEWLGSVALSGDLLPDWYDDWLLIDRERVRQARLHVLEIVCEQLLEAGRAREAIETGVALVAAEPLRESAQRALIGAHLAAGNVGEALRQYRGYRSLLADSLGLTPTESMEALVASIGRC